MLTEAPKIAFENLCKKLNSVSWAEHFVEELLNYERNGMLEKAAALFDITTLEERTAP